MVAPSLTDLSTVAAAILMETAPSGVRPGQLWRKRGTGQLVRVVDSSDVSRHAEIAEAFPHLWPHRDRMAIRDLLDHYEFVGEIRA